MTMRSPARIVSVIVSVCAAVVLAACAPTPPPAAAPAPDSPAPAAAPRVAPLPPGLAQDPIPVPPVVTGVYPTSCHAVGKLPDPRCTPGSVNPAVTQATIRTTICVNGWAGTMRPPESNTGPVKIAAMKAYGEDPATRGTTELDHLVPIEAGGSDSVKNLWPQPSDIPNAGFRNRKDPLENALHAAVCATPQPLVSLTAAQTAIATDWTTAYAKLGLTVVNGNVCLTGQPTRCAKIRSY